MMLWHFFVCVVFNMDLFQADSPAMQCYRMILQEQADQYGQGGGNGQRASAW